MTCITRCVLRYGVIGALALGGVTLLVGPDRMAAGFSHVRSSAQNLFDDAMDDPISLRRQLAELAEQYPDRIVEVKGEIAEVNHQIGQFERDIRVAQKVVSLTTDDLQTLKALVHRAEVASDKPGARTVAIRFEGVRYDVAQALKEGFRINGIRDATMDRLGHDKYQIKFLQEQDARLKEILGTLVEEYNTYQAQLWQLDRQIEAIARNDRLIEMTEEQQATLASFDRFGRITNLKQLEAKLAELRAVQDAQLQALEQWGMGTDYEKAAEYQLDTGDLDLDPFSDVIEIELPLEAPLIDSDPLAFAPFAPLHVIEE